MLEQKSNLHFVRYGISADESYFQEFEDTIDGIFINGNMIAHMPGALSKFIGEKLVNKTFLIDPLTHAFQHDIVHLMSENKKGEKNIKTSIRKMLDIYGDPVKSCIESSRVVLPAHFASSEVIDHFALSVSNFQINALKTESSDLLEYYEFAEIESPLEPEYIIAPYFYMDASDWQDWIEINVRLIKSTVIQFPLKKVCAQIVISHDLLVDINAVDRIIERYSYTKINIYALWIDNFDEHEASTHMLKNYINLLASLSKNAPIIILYGSYFSVALMKYCKQLNIKVVGHGLEYGESRGVVPVGGGIPVSKFYYPSLHARIRFNEAFTLARSHLEKGKEYFYSNVCSCNICKEIMESTPSSLEAFGLYGESKPITFRRKNQVVTLDYPEQVTKERCVRHYLYNKNNEYRSKITLGTVLQSLQDAYDQYTPLTGSRLLKHCLNWKEALQYAFNLGRKDER